MDLGCLDLCCTSASESVLESDNKGNSSVGSSTATLKIGKSKQTKENGHSSLNTLNKSGLQIKKSGHRKNSPINWFPRKKADSYLNRKIKMLQEVAGMNLTLDETLGDSNPHYSKLLREKMASREAAHKAIEARKAALVEASWCRILQAARIESKEAEVELKKANEIAAEAFEAALAIGVNMYDIPNCPQKPLEADTSSYRDGLTASHNIKASFETAFEVDKEVASAVKTALTKLAKRPSFNRDEFKDLLRKISQNPDNTDENDEEQQRSGDSSPRSESKSGSETETGSQLRRRRSKRRLSLERLNSRKLVNTMSDRLERLKDEELSSLATIVATCGLNAALSEIKNDKLDESHLRKRQTELELPSLDKCLVKHVTKLEREVQEARNRAKEVKVEPSEKMVAPDLGTVLTKKHSSRLEKAIEIDKKNFDNKYSSNHRKEDSPRKLPSLDKFLVKHVTGLEKAVQEAKNQRQNERKGKENLEVNKESEKGLDKILVKPVYSHRLHREKQEALASGFDYGGDKAGKKKEWSECESLEMVLAKKPVSRLEREKTVAQNDDENGKASSVSRREARERELQEAWGGLGLGNSLKPHVSRLQRDKDAWIKADEEERKAKQGFFGLELKEN